MKTTLGKAKELLENQSAKGIEKTIDRAVGLALVALAQNLGRVATALDKLADKVEEKGDK